MKGRAVTMDNRMDDRSGHYAWAAALEEAQRHALSARRELRPDDPRLGGNVRLVHRDGTRTRMEFAFLEADGDWVYVFRRGAVSCAVYRRDELAEYEQQNAGPALGRRAGDAAH